MSDSGAAEKEGDAGRRAATEARERVRFEEEALELADQVYRVARRMVGTRRGGRRVGSGHLCTRIPELEVVHSGDEHARLDAADPDEPEHRPRAQDPADADQQPLEESDYFLANKLAAVEGEQALDQERVVERLSQGGVVDALAALPHDFRDVVVLVDLGDFSYADAAQILDVPIGTVMSRLHRGRRILKKTLAEESLT